MYIYIYIYIYISFPMFIDHPRCEQDSLAHADERTHFQEITTAKTKENKLSNFRYTSSYTYS